MERNDDDSRSDLEQALMILSGETLLQPEKRHLEALHEYHEVQLIRIANQLDTLKCLVLGME